MNYKKEKTKYVWSASADSSCGVYVWRSCRLILIPFYVSIPCRCTLTVISCILCIIILMFLFFHKYRKIARCSQLCCFILETSLLIFLILTLLLHSNFQFSILILIQLLIFLNFDPAPQFARCVEI